MKRTILAGVFSLGAMATPAMSETLKHAFQGSLKSLDPYSLAEGFTLGFLANTYEGLVRRDENLQIEPALATSWEVLEPTRWRFHLRKGVKFHNGNEFTADDVLFSAERVRSEGSDLNSRIPEGAEFIKVDDHTVDVVLETPNPILHYDWETWMMIDSDWAKENNSLNVASANDDAATAISLEANGTGPFRIVSHEAGVQTVLEPNADWWDEVSHDLTRIEFNSIPSDATRVAALLSGEMDLIYPVPVQDIKRVDSNPTTAAITGPDLRTIVLGMDQQRDELLESNVKGKNPFKDARVRRAFYHAINIDAIKQKIMRNLSTPASLMIAPQLFSGSDEFARLPYDVDAAKALLAEAGYPDGFEVVMDCPNDRYVNDEAICQAVVSMLAKVGVKVTLNAQTKSKFFGKIRASGGYSSSFFLLGVTPGTFDSHMIIGNLHGCRDAEGKGGPFNFAGYCNEKVDELAALIEAENDPAVRDDLISQAYRIITDEVAYIPLHQQNLAWGVSDKFDVKQRADNKFLFRHVVKN